MYNFNFCTILFLLSVSGIACEDACTSGLCRCVGNNVYCIGLNLTYIPKIPSKSLRLTFEDNFLPNITSETLVNVSSSKVFVLKLMSNHIQNIDKDAFVNVTQLDEVDLSGNPLTIESVYAMVYEAQAMGLEELYFRGIGLNSLPSDLFRGMESSNLSYVDFSQNFLSTLNFSVFKPLRALRTLKFAKNNLQSVFLDYAPNLRLLDLSFNSIRDLPNFCDNGHPYFPRIKVVSLQHNSICEYIPKNLNCLKTLSSLMFHGNCVSVIKTNSFASLSSLTELFFGFQSSSKSAFRIKRFAFNNSNLKDLVLSGNQIVLRNVDTLAFHGCTNVRYLDLSFNTLKSFSPEYHQRLNKVLSPLTELCNLSMISADLFNIPTGVKQFPNLKTLKLRGNRISSWPKDLFILNTKLEVLKVQNNRIKTVTEIMFPPQLRNQLKSIALEGNPFECNCDLLWFIEWIHRDSYKFEYFPKRYRCLNITRRVCFNNLQLYDSITAVICIIISVLLIVAIVHKYRWFIKYQIYIWRHQPKLRELIVQREYKYDVFVSYCWTDRDWIVDRLLPQLEEDEHLKLCIHDRDFHGGKLIMDNIVDALENSRRVLIVLSNGFAQSEWCQFEVSMSQRQVLNEVSDPLVVVLLEDIDNEFMSNTLRVLLKTTTYITWDDDNPQDVHLFWNRLKRSLQTD